MTIPEEFHGEFCGVDGIIDATVLATGKGETQIRHRATETAVRVTAVTLLRQKEKSWFKK